MGCGTVCWNSVLPCKGSNLNRKDAKTQRQLYRFALKICPKGIFTSLRLCVFAVKTEEGLWLTS